MQHRQPVTFGGHNALTERDEVVKPYLKLAVALLAGVLATAVDAAPVLMISIDGLRPLDVIDSKRGFTAPNLRRIMAEGSYSTGVRNSLPTVTYPNHTTLITGVWPAKHGIANNTTFDPEAKNFGGWYWYASDIKVPTLWDVVHASGGSVASIGWPVSVGTSSIDDNLPEYWRTRIAEDLKVVRALATPGLPARVEAKSGVSIDAMFSEEATADDAKVAEAAAIYALDRPEFFTIHLSSLDHFEHGAGPGSAKAKATLEQIDAAVGRLVDAARAAEPNLVVVVVSDHGFANVDHSVDIERAFVEAGLMSVDPVTHKVTAWEAAPWGGASAAIVLAHPGDAAIVAKTKALLDRLAADPALGINRVADAAEIARLGGTPMASFWIDFKPGYSMGHGPEMVSPSNQKGTHGYFPEHPEMRAAFFAAGAGVPHKGAIGEIDQRDIAPTVARLLGVALPSADGKPLF